MRSARPVPAPRPSRSEPISTRLRLTDLVGRRVRDQDRAIGRVADLVADLSFSPARVTGVDVRARGVGRRTSSRYSWSGTRLSHRLLVVEDAPVPRVLAEHELLLRRDLQDTRV